MNKNAHTTKSGPGRRHKEFTYRNGERHFAKTQLPGGYPGSKLERKAVQHRLTLRG